MTLYEFDQAKDRFTTPPSMDGERQDKYMVSEVNKDDAQAVLVRLDRNIYAPDATKEKILYNPGRVRSEEKGKPFVEREGIKSSAGVLLKVRKEIRGEIRKEGREEVRDETVGVMFVNYRSRRDFTDSERRLIETFASYAAIAIQAARTAARQKAEELGAIREIDLGIAAALDLDILLVQILEKGLQRLRIIDGYGVLHLLDEDAQQLEVFAEACLPEGDARRNLRVDDPETPACAARSRTTKLLSSEGTAADLKPLVPGVSSEMATPLLRGDRLLGVLTLGSTKRDGIVDTDRHFLESLAGQAVVAIHHSERVRLLEQLRDVLSDIDSAKDWRDALQRVAQRSLDVLKADDAFIIPLDPDHDEFLMGEVVHARRPGLEEASFELNLPQERGIARAVLAQKLVAVDNIASPPEQMRNVSGVAGLAKHKIAAFVGVSLDVRGQQEKSMGVLYIDYKDAHHFTRAELDRLRAFADEAAIVIQKARQEERRQILQWQADLNSFGSGFAHRVGNLLGTLPVDFARAQEAFQRGDLRTLGRYFELLTSDVETVRRIIAIGHQIKEAQTSEPVPCDLNQCIQDAVAVAPKREDIKVERQLDADLPKIYTQQVVITNLLADLVDNALRAMPDGGHLRLRSYLSQDRQWVVGEVIDNGKGIDERIRSRVLQQPFVTGRSDGLGLGLWLAHQTMSRFQGTISFESESGHGTTIIMRFPVRKE